MKISYNWLKDYVAHSLSPEELAHALTMAGLEEETEDRQSIGETYEGLVVGHVLSKAQHPNADKLSVCMVDLGLNLNNGEPSQIVCGAPNVAAGQKVIVATIGTKLMMPTEKHNPDAPKSEITIKKGKIRGEESNGMICSAMELGLSNDHDGIMVLDENAEVGTPFLAYLRQKGQLKSDVVFDFNVTPNRPDATSHFGIARDVAALTGLSLQKPEVVLPQEGGTAATEFAVEIECPETCHRYVGLLVKGVKIAESPQWMKDRLEAIGLRPRNNVVDVTNYVMYECGQPLHAFDFDQIAGHKIVVRQLSDKLKFTTLDDKEQDLPAGTMMICDAEREVAIAGVMGGQNSEVTDSTVNVLIEAAWFDPASVRKTAKKVLTKPTDASYRFERGIDTEGQVWAAARAAQLILETAGGTLIEGMVDEHPVEDAEKTVTIRSHRAHQIIGTHIETDEMVRLLEAIGFEVSVSSVERPDVASNTTDLLHCTIPTFRPDIEREIDVIEEIARLYGYDNIPAPAHSLVPNEPPKTNPADDLRNATLVFGAGLGFRELYTNSMVKKETAALFVDEMHIVETLNPISSEMGALRPSLLSGVLAVLSHNIRHGSKNLRVMEFGNTFRKTESPRVLVRGYDQRESFIMAMTGTADAATWQHSPNETNIYDLKGIGEALLHRLGLDQQVQMIAQNEGSQMTEYQINLQMGAKNLGTIGLISAEVAKRFDVKQPVFFMELDWTGIQKLVFKQDKKQFNSISKYPIVERCLAFVVEKAVPSSDLLDTIRKTGGKLLQDVVLFDLYEGDNIAPTQKSLAFALQLGSTERTLVDKEIDQLAARVIKRVSEVHNGHLRS